MKKVLAYGTFDLFHIGHLNFLKRASEYGDYLIVGVSTDEFNSIKGKKSYIPFEQRKEIVKSIKYVDEVIDENNWDQKIDDIKKYDASVIVTVEEWRDRFKYLEKYVDVVYLKPTDGISSSKIKSDLAISYKKEKKLNIFVKALIYMYKFLLSFVYFFMKLFKTNNNKVVFISKRFNTVPLYYKMYIDELLKNDVEVKVLCKKVKRNFKGYLSYGFEVFRQMYHIATSKVCVVDTYCIPVSNLKHKSDLKIVQTWHAMMAIKKFGYQSLNKDDGRNKDLARILNMHQNYDYVISGSSNMTDCLVEAFKIDRSKIHEIGSSTIDYLVRNKESIREDIYLNYPELLEKPTVLYVPTFRKGRKVLDHDLIENFNYDKYNLIIKYHPAGKNKVIDERIFKCNEYSSYDLLTVADYIITDYSSIAAEASIFEKPILFYVYDIDDYKYSNGLNIDLYKEMPNCVFKNACDLLNKIEKNDFNNDDIINFRDKFVSNINGTCSLLLTEYILSCLGVKREVLYNYVCKEKQNI